jgi:hypothetical protein
MHHSIVNTPLIASLDLQSRAKIMRLFYGVPLTFRCNTVAICCNSQNKIEPYKNKLNRTKIIRTRTKINRKETQKNKSKGNGSEHKIDRKRKSLTKYAGLVKNADTDCGQFFYFIYNYQYT